MVSIRSFAGYPKKNIYLAGGEESQVAGDAGELAGELVVLRPGIVNDLDFAGAIGGEICRRSSGRERGKHMPGRRRAERLP